MKFLCFKSLCINYIAGIKFYMSYCIHTKHMHSMNIKFVENITIFTKHTILQNGKKQVYTTYTLFKW